MRRAGLDARRDARDASSIVIRRPLFARKKRDERMRRKRRRKWKWGRRWRRKRKWGRRCRRKKTRMEKRRKL